LCSEEALLEDAEEQDNRRLSFAQHLLLLAAELLKLPSESFNAGQWLVKVQLLHVDSALAAALMTQPMHVCGRSEALDALKEVGS
jgi:hypothetical protein